MSLFEFEILICNELFNLSNKFNTVDEKPISNNTGFLSAINEAVIFSTQH